MSRSKHLLSSWVPDATVEGSNIVKGTAPRKALHVSKLLCYSVNTGGGYFKLVPIINITHNYDVRRGRLTLDDRPAISVFLVAEHAKLVFSKGRSEVVLSTVRSA